jgi:hypothetical protein
VDISMRKLNADKTQGARNARLHSYGFTSTRSARAAH